MRVGREQSDRPCRISPDDTRGLGRRSLTRCGDDEDQGDSDKPMVPLHTLKGVRGGGNGSRLAGLPAEAGFEVEQLLLLQFAAANKARGPLSGTRSQDPGILDHFQVRGGAEIGVVRTRCDLERDLDAMDSEGAAEYELFVERLATDDGGAAARAAQAALATDWGAILNFDAHDGLSLRPPECTLFARSAGALILKNVFFLMPGVALSARRTDKRK